MAAAASHGERGGEANDLGFKGDGAGVAVLFGRKDRTTVGFDPTAGGGRATNGPKAAREGAAREAEIQAQAHVAAWARGEAQHRVGRGPEVAMGSKKF